MSGVWVFKQNGVIRLAENPSGCDQTAQRRKTLVHTPSGEAVCSHEALERKLTALGWERYCADPDMRQYHKRSSVDLISLPKDFNKVKSMHMYDIVVKNPNVFQVVDAAVVHAKAEDKADADQAEASDADQAEASDADQAAA